MQKKAASKSKVSTRAAQSRPSYTPSFGFATMIGGLSAGRYVISPGTLYQLYRGHPDLWACVRQRSRNVGRAGIEFLRQDGTLLDEKDQDRLRKQLDLGRPFGKWKNRLMRDVVVTGNFYGHLTLNQLGGPLKLDWLDPRTVSVVTDEFGEVLKWIQCVGGKMVMFAPDEIMHFHFEDDPDSPVYGLSPVEPLFWEIRTDLAAVTSNFSFFENDATPSVHFVMNDDVSVDEANKVLESINAQLKGAENRHKSVALAGVKEIRQMSVTPKDMDFGGLRRLTTEKVCAAMGVPKTILNYTEKVDRANGKEQFRIFRELTVEPDERDLESWLTHNLLPKLVASGLTDFDGLVMRYKTPKDEEDREWDEASTRADQAQGILTTNEVRLKRGLVAYTPDQAAEWADKPIVLAGNTAKPLEDIGSDPNDMGGVIPEPAGDISANALIARRRAVKAKA